ncbi:17965_t:CDS:2, partial [Funneliformis geosporum]
MSQYLPTGGFRWLDLDKLPDIRSISPTAKRGSAWEVKLKYPDKLHPTHTEYPLCPERRIVKRQELDLVRPIGEEHRLRKMLADPALVG